MSPKGRPTDNPKKGRFEIRTSQEEEEMLDYCCEITGKKRTDIIRLGIRKVYEEFCLVSFVMIIVIIVRTLIWGDPVSGWPSLACIIFMVSGVQLLCTGIVGQYLSKTYLETKHRPIFILKDSSEEETRTHYEYEH